MRVGTILRFGCLSESPFLEFILMSSKSNEDWILVRKKNLIDYSIGAGGSHQLLFTPFSSSQTSGVGHE